MISRFLSPLLGLLSGIPWYMWAIGAATAMAMFNGHRYRSTREEFDAAKSDAILERKASELAASQETNRRKDVQKGASDEANRKIARLQSSLATQSLASEQLLQQLAAVQAAGCGRNSGSSSRGLSSDQAQHLSADVSRRLAEAEDRTSEFAERSAIAAETCKSSYDALKSKHKD